MDFAPSPAARDTARRVRAFMDEHITPIEMDYHRELRERDDPWVVLPIVRELQAKARDQGLWNLFLPDISGLSVLDYATVAEQTGRSLLAPWIFNCNAPDTGNMEVLHLYGSEAQKERWLKPLLAGEIRSAFCMTEPEVASSDATNMQATCVADGDDVVINGRKWWTTGAGNPECAVFIFMGLTDPDAPRRQQHSMILVPRDTPGVRIERLLHVFSDQDPPFGHAEISFTNVRVPKENIIAGLGRGFEIAQGRLGPGRIHHCMRCIGSAELALELLCQRATKRVAFGKPLANLGGNRDIIANARIAIEQARLLTLRAAWSIDKHGALGSMSEISQIKVVAPNVAATIIDQAIQIHGGAGLCHDFPLAGMYANARILRLADGPDEVHRGLISRFELSKYKDRK